MSNTIDCPTCGGKSKIIETNGENCFKVVDKVELLKKVIKLIVRNVTSKLITKYITSRFRSLVMLK